VHFQRELGPELELARKVAGVGQVGIVVDRGELIPRLETVIMSEHIRNLMALVIPIGSRGMPPADWTEMGIRRLLEIRRECDVRVTIDGGVNRCTIKGASVRAVDRVVVGGLLFGNMPSFHEIAKNIQTLNRCS
jgi:pentose-5-phosphate-3-epimerase